MTTRALILSVFLVATQATAAEKFDAAKLDRIADAAHAAFKRGDCPGAVMRVRHGEEVVTSRVRFSEKAQVTALRRQVADIVAEKVGKASAPKSP